MKRTDRRLVDKALRQAHLNTRGKRERRGAVLRGVIETYNKVYSVVSKYAGKPINEETRDAMLADLVATLPPTPKPIDWVQASWTTADGMIHMVLTPEATRLFATPPSESP